MNSWLVFELDEENKVPAYTCFGFPIRSINAVRADDELAAVKTAVGITGRVSVYMPLQAPIINPAKLGSLYDEVLNTEHR
jgi:hypothetical protein